MVPFRNWKCPAEKNQKVLQAQLGDVNKRLTEGNLQLNDLENGNRKSMAENGELLRQLEEIDGKQKLIKGLRG